LTSTAQAASLFSDGFETGNFSNWNSVQGLSVQNQEAANGSFAVRAAGGTATPLGTYAFKTLASSQTNLYYRVRFKVTNQGPVTVNLLKLRSATNAPLWSVSINNLGQLSYRNDVRATSVNGGPQVAKGVWHSLEVHLQIAGSDSRTEVWLNGTLVSALSRTEDFGTNPVGRVQLGENTGSLSYDIAFDDVAVATSFISP
jgi:hypothetical protein